MDLVPSCPEILQDSDIGMGFGLSYNMLKDSLCFWRDCTFLILLNNGTERNKEICRYNMLIDLDTQETFLNAQNNTAQLSVTEDYQVISDLVRSR